MGSTWEEFGEVNTRLIGAEALKPFRGEKSGAADSQNQNL